MNESVPPHESEPTSGKKTSSGTKTRDPVRAWTFILLSVAFVVLIIHLRADRFTPYTSQARLNALVVPVAAEVAGQVVAVHASNNQRVEAGQTLFEIDRARYALAVQTAEANLQAARQAVGASTANVEAARASVASARANLERTTSDYARLRRITEEDPGAVSERRV
jgi:multidrug resistance efflux pump